MFRTAIFLLALTFAICARGERPCAQPDLHPAAERVLALQSQLLAVKVGYHGMDDGVPAPVQVQIHALKDELATLAALAMACAPASVEAGTLEETLRAALGADKPKTPAGDAGNSDAPMVDHLFGADLAVKVLRPAKLGVVLFDFRLGIPCGYDAVLLAYEWRHVHWVSALRWQSPDYDEISGAFGDFFNYRLLQPGGGEEWFVAVAHGHPWCTSNMSAFDVDVLQPGEFTDPQKVVYHEGAGYSRNDNPVFRDEPDGFELKMLANSLDLSIIFRPVIYRYRVTAGSPEISPVERVQPIAENGRDFVDEWLQAPWGEAVKWAAQDGMEGLEAEHKRMEALRAPGAEWPVFHYGPVRACEGSKTRFQVELDELPGDTPRARAGPPLFFQVEEGKNAFTMLSVSTLADGHCTGADIMPRE